MKWLAAALLLAACDGTGGVISLSLATAPGSDLLANVEKLRVTTTDPPTVTEAVRNHGIDLSVEFDAQDAAGKILVEGFDASDNLIASGQSAPFPLGGGDASLVIYVASPFSIGEAPVRLTTARGDLAASPILFGAIVTGGSDSAGGLSDAVTIYNVYSHSLQEGAPLPSRRRGQAIGANIVGGVYMFGGAGENGLPTSTLYEFISTVAPAGSYLTVGDQEGLERVDQHALTVGPDFFVVTGTPPVDITANVATPRDDIANLSAAGASYPGSSVAVGPAAALTVDGSSLVTFDASTSAAHALPAVRVDAAVAALPDGSFLVVGGQDRDAFLVTDAGVTILPQLLSTTRAQPTVASTAHYIVVAGGTDAGTPIASADIIDAATLALVTTVPLTPRVHAQAVAMQNEQVMLIGGDDPTTLIELFTPPVSAE